MGRYYNGDINGKFWFAVQNSDDAEQFGASGSEPNHINYYADDLDGCKRRLDELFTALEIEPRFNFGDESAVDDYAWTINPENTPKYVDHLVASLQLGLKMYVVMKEQGYVEFEAEL